MAAQNAPRLNFAPGVRFDEALHQYWKNGKQLSGVTGVIGKHLGMKYHEGTVMEARGEGLHVHHAIEEWIDSGCSKVNSIHPGVLWLTGTLLHEVKEYGKIKDIYSEVLVSDGFQYSSAIDIVVEFEDGALLLGDTKRSFKRPSVTIQLNMYKYIVEKYFGRKVIKMICACFNEEEYYSIAGRSHEEIEKIFYKAGK